MDGAPVRGVAIRPPVHADLPGIAAMWERCSRATRLARFHAPVRDIPASYTRAVLGDPAGSVLAVAGRPDSVVALASLFRDRSGTAELGVLVEDAWQRRGVGTRLVAHLLATAPARGISVLTASVRSENAPVAHLLRRIPGECSVVSHGLTVHVAVRFEVAGSQSQNRPPGKPVWCEHGPARPHRRAASGAGAVG